jgi:hypothetical protein
MLVLYYCYHVLSLEVECKVNSRQSYTRFNYISHACLYFAATVNGVYHKYSSDVGYDIIQNVAVLFYMLMMARFVVVFSLAVYHEFYAVNFYAVQDAETTIHATKENKKFGTL